MYVCTYTYVGMYIHICRYVHTHMYVWTYTYVSMYIHICMYVCTYTYVCMNVVKGCAWHEASCTMISATRYVAEKWPKCYQNHPKRIQSYIYWKSVFRTFFRKWLNIWLKCMTIWSLLWQVFSPKRHTFAQSGHTGNDLAKEKQRVGTHTRTSARSIKLRFKTIQAKKTQPRDECRIS
jgi:hypothetical protein